MARREWADKLADAQTCPQCAEQYGMGDNGDIVHASLVARLLRKEHARAVRIVQRLQKNAERGGFGLAYGVALKDVLAALTKGRA